MGNKRNIESELKYFLEKEAHTKLVHHFKKNKSVRIQHFLNYFFDTPELGLQSKRIGFRVRLVNNKRAFLTLKTPIRDKKTASPKSSLTVRREFESPLALRLALSLIQNKRKLGTLQHLIPVKILKKNIPAEMVDRVVPLGKIATARRFIPLKDFTLELDRCTMFGEVFYELEIETEAAKPADEFVRTLFKKLEIQYRPSRRSKLRRFILRWKKSK